MSKQCAACTEIYPVEYFYVDKARPDGLMGRCIVCTKNKSKSVLRMSRNKLSKTVAARRRSAACKKYEKTKRGLLMRAYRNMLSRVRGIQKKKAHIYLGLSILDKKTFYAWSLADPSYNILYDAWIESGYARTLTPSIDRIDNARGYEEGNIRWLTHSQNSRLGSLSQQSLEIFITT